MWSLLEAAQAYRQLAGLYRDLLERVAGESPETDLMDGSWSDWPAASQLREHLGKGPSLPVIMSQGMTRTGRVGDEGYGAESFLRD